MTVDLHCGDSLEVLKTFPDNTFDTVISDPPSGIFFMGKNWDSDKGGRAQWIAWLTEIMAECLRVTKPGGSALVWSIPRTSHWTGTALEMAGWEVRDVVSHIFATGFPKSMDISKAIDKMAGVEREVIGHGRQYSDEGGAREYRWEGGTLNHNVSITAPATEAARVWDGWGSGGLKPAAEFWWLCQKPLQGTYAENALRYGVSGLAIDRARIPANDKATFPAGVISRTEHNYGNGNGLYADRPRTADSSPNGRWPSNLILQCLCERDDGTHDNPECPCAILDAQSGERKSGGRIGTTYNGQGAFSTSPRPSQKGKVCADFEPSTGGASRFFVQVKPDASRMIYAAKASRRERNAGLEGMPERVANSTGWSGEGMPLRQDGTERKTVMAQNHHPTVKSLSLMRYLCRLTSTPTGGSVLDPFCGSGSTGCAAVLEGRSFVGIDIDPEYVAIAEKRIAYWQAQAAQPMLLAAD